VLEVRKSNLYAMTFRGHTGRLDPLAALAAMRCPAAWALILREQGSE
jgi:hypothetical protein